MSEPSKLHILWTNNDVLTSQLMVIFYATTSMVNKLWDSVTVIIWGAPVELVAESEVIQDEIRAAQNVGVKFSACTSCANRLGVVEELEGLGIEVTPWAEPFTKLVKNGEAIVYV